MVRVQWGEPDDVEPALLFLAAGNLRLAYGSKRVEDVRGASRLVPVTAALWIAGFPRPSRPSRRRRSHRRDGGDAPV
jgi:hypothetical protein